MLIATCSKKIETSDIEFITYHKKLKYIQSIADSAYITFSSDSTIRYKTYKLDSNTTSSVSYRADTLLSIVYRTNEIDTSVAEYYPNGQIIGDVNFLSDGKLDGSATYYYSDGRIRTIGQFNKGKWWGKWKNYNYRGELIEFIYYDENGNLKLREKMKN